MNLLGSDFEPLNAELYSIREEHLDGGFHAAWGADEPGAWEALAREIHPGIYELRVFTREFCSQLVDEVEHIEGWCARQGLQLQRPNSMNDHGLILDQVGFEDLLQELMVRYLRPLLGSRYPRLGGASLDQHHGFVVDYARGKDEDLGFHVDDSEVTLNLCLGENFDGSELYFRGARCERHRQTPSRPGEDHELHHEPGIAILHAGKQRHGVHPLRRGRRRNLILWCRSSSYRAALPQGPVCPQWCGVWRASGGGPT